MNINKYIIMALLLCVGCTSMKFWIPAYLFDEVIVIKNQIDTAKNPAQEFLFLKQLEKKRVKVNNAIVKEIVNSINIDYTFSVIATVEHSTGPIDCYIYTRNWRNQEDYNSVAQLKPGDTIYVIGRFSRFLKFPGNKYAVELVESNISIVK
ncbi:MAG: hypothetical protein ACUVRK_11430 [Spirochaetota bacterium]